jgi:hypothetical protein
MRTGKRHLIRVAVIVLASLAIVPAAQASGTSPDDRALPRGTESQVATNVSPDDRAYPRDSSVSAATRIVGPDDRGYVRGNWQPPPTVIVSPDDRAFPRATPEPRMIQVTGSIQTHGFDWGDALIGGTFGLALAMLGAGGVALLMRRRSVLRTV